ncbi:hypothetical protein NG799_25755 [Laspinema sp. D1]|jgi:hypothetical protein|uniref:Uncharacterized protein n=1 Tax=Laspinema palackyanum D2a TaxID=2953684 RepID=A0ABT2MYW5_9CYAN|nr:hypothetical protein [Laspinema sp. D2a]
MSQQIIADLPPNVSWLSNSSIEQLLGISSSLLRQDKAVLKELELIELPERSRGCNREAIEILIKFRQLVKERGRTEAIKEIWRLYDG